MSDPLSNAHLDKILNTADLIHSSQAIDRALNGLALELNREYLGKQVLVLVIMNGGLVTTGQLLPKLDFQLEVDYVHATRYGNNTRGSEVVWSAKPKQDLQDKHILLVDDIYDEGITLAEVIKFVDSQHPASLKTALLLNKAHDRKAEGARADYSALTVPDRYVFGFGMDYKGFLRNVPGIYAVADS